MTVIIGMVEFYLQCATVELTVPPSRGAVNTLHVGGQYTNKLKVAVVPLKDGPLGVLWPEGTT